MDPLDTVSTVRLYRVIADQIAAKIDSGDFGVGERLPAERLLAEQLGVSRASVREALIALELEHYVDVRVGVGVFVVDHRQHTARQASAARCDTAGEVEIGPFDLLRTRLLLEPEAAAGAARTATDPQLAEVAYAQSRLAQGTQHQVHDRAFHLAIAHACGNAALESAILHIWDLSSNNPVFIRLDDHYVASTDWDLAAAEHAKVLAALRSRDVEGARAAMKDHLSNVLDRLHRDFDQTASA